MFDDHPSIPQASSVPSNLPLGEPPDIFEGTESSDPIAPVPASMAAAPVIPAPSSALNAGILTPKAPSMSAPVSMETPPLMGSENTLKEPKLSHGIMVAIMTLVIAFVLLGSAWFVYTMFNKKPADGALIPVDTIPAVNNPSTLVNVTTTPSLDTVVSTSSDAVDREIILGEAADSDGDGLKDDREKELGTDPSNWDSDSDDLSDGEEILIWHTNPKNADTDADTYKDGAEIKSGYNPSGPGRLAEMNKVSSTTPNSLSSLITIVSSTPVSTSSVSVTASTTTSSIQIPGQIQL